MGRVDHRRVFQHHLASGGVEDCRLLPPGGVVAWPLFLRGGSEAPVKSSLLVNCSPGRSSGGRNLIQKLLITIKICTPSLLEWNIALQFFPEEGTRIMSSGRSLV